MAHDYQTSTHGSDAGSATPMGGEQPHRSLSNFGDGEEEKSFTLYVGNLPLSCIQADIDTIFAEFKQHITKVRMIHDKETARFRGFCYVEFNNAEAFSEALRGLNGADYGGSIIKVDQAAPKGRGGGGGGASGFGGRQYNNNNNQQFDSYNQRGAGRNNYNRSYPDAGGYQRNSGYPPAGGYPDAGYGGQQRGGYPQGGYDDRGGYQQAGGYQGGAGGYGRPGGYNQPGGGYRGGRDSYQNNRPYNIPRPGGGRYQADDIMPVEPAHDRPKLELKKREVNAPPAALADSAARSKIFGDALPREFNSKVRETVESATPAAAPAASADQQEQQQQTQQSGEKP